MWVAFEFAKATHIFVSKNTCELDIVLTRIVNILSTNEHVKLTTLWTTGTWFPKLSAVRPQREELKYTVSQHINEGLRAVLFGDSTLTNQTNTIIF